MDRKQLVNLLNELNDDNLIGKNRSEELLLDKFENISKQLNVTYQEICNVLKNAELFFSKDTPADWKYVCISLYILYLLNNELESHDELLSVQQRNIVKKSVQSIITLGILTKLQPNLPFHIAIEQPQPTDIFLNYNILKCTTHSLCQFLKLPNMRFLILPDNLKAVLVAVYQICFCPLKKPVKKEGDLTTGMSEEMYSKLLQEKAFFLKLLEHLRETIHPVIFVKETMAIFFANAPVWFKKSVSQTLTSIIRSRNGLDCVATALLDGSNNDTTQTWKILEVFSKLILSCKTFPDFQDNICKQLSGMLDKITYDESLIFERIYTHCAKSIYHVDEELGKNIFVRRIVVFFLYFTYRDHKFEEGELLIDKIKQHSRLLHAVFIESSVENQNLPLDLITPVINVIFKLYALTLNSGFKSTNSELKEVLLAYLNLSSVNHNGVFDCFLFEIDSKEILPFRNDIILKIDKEDIILEYSSNSVIYSVAENSECLLELLKNKTDLLVKLFGFLLNCLTNKDKYFQKSNQGLLDLETQFMHECLERKLIVYKNLSDLAEDKNIQTHITKNPDDIVKYMNKVFQNSIASSTHKSTDFDSEEYQTFFTTLMILQLLVTNSSPSNLKDFRVLNECLEVIKNESLNEEVNNLVRKILDILQKEVRATRMVVNEVKSELDKALEDICDPLLPLRGHGLMTLTKLVENRDNEVMERKHYILNIFQQSLKNEDSFIYLSAIGGLATMAGVFPDTVLNILCEEYSDCYRKNNDDGHEVRMKLGESLVRVTKRLGDMAPKYKTLLLNTFLVGAKDEDHLIRASSLSNLGEICRVLGYKLGTIVTEVLVCVHATITTDKSPEARRAAVTVLRQLLVGLESEMITFLKEDILPIYRTLKEIYHNDKDDVMRLQAQLALEELNENMRNFVFPKPQLSTEKKIVMLN